MSTILVTGGRGLLGQTLVPFLRDKACDVAVHSRTGGTQFDCDLTDAEKTFVLLDRIKPSAIINLVALTDVDQCDEIPHSGYLANVRTVENVVAWIKASSVHCHLIHISTDQVYDGQGPHVEEAVTLSNCYALSKYAGEIAASLVPSTILRTNFFGRSQLSSRRSLTDWLHDSLSQGKGIEVFDDILFSPLSMQRLSDIIYRAMKHQLRGVFNAGSHRGLSKADFAFYFGKQFAFPLALMKRTTSDQVTFLKTYRPKDMRMNCKKIETALQFELPTLEEEIKAVAEEYHATA